MLKPPSSASWAAEAQDQEAHKVHPELIDTLLRSTLEQLATRDFERRGTSLRAVLSMRESKACEQSSP